MNDNVLCLYDIKNKTLDFKGFLKMTDSITIKNSNNIKIKIKSKINKIIFKNCNDIKLKISDMISGIEINNCKNLKIKIIKNKKINLIESYKSNVQIKLQEKQEKEIKFILEESNIDLKLY